MEQAPTKILLVDDSPVVVAVVERQLAKLGYQADTAKNGAEALDLISKPGKKYGLVMTDIQMPEMGGLQLTRTLRQAGNTVPVLLISGDDAKTGSAHAQDSGANGFLTKPIELGVLQTTLASLMSPVPAPPAARQGQPVLTASTPS